MENELIERNEIQTTDTNLVSIQSADFILPDPEAIAKRAEQTKKNDVCCLQSIKPEINC